MKSLNANTKIVKEEHGGRRWCVITDDGMMKCFNNQTEARKYQRRLSFWHKEFDYSITKRNRPWLDYEAPNEK